MRERISMIVPVRDGATFLPAALASLLSQSRRPDEVIVVDDGSRDASAAIADATPGVLLVRRPPLGAAAARNAGLAAATGTLIGFLDADDFAEPERLRVQAGLLTADPALDGAAGLARNVTDRSPGRPDPAHAGEPVRSYSLGTLLLRRELIERVGPLEEALSHGDAVDWIRRMRLAGARFDEHDDVVLLRRVHGANMTLADDAAAGYLRLARAAITRHRQEQR